MRAPDFWRGPELGVAARLLSPLAALYGAAAARRLRRNAPQSPLPTIVVGGPTVGGDGKTPTALALAALLTLKGERPVFVTRGYGRRGEAAPPFLVDLTRHDARRVGDEAILLARAAKTVVGAERRAALRLAASTGASVAILDDGFHSRAVAADLALLVVDADYGVGNGLALPAGPLRAPLAAQLCAADAVLILGEGASAEAIEAQAALRGKAVFRAAVEPKRRLDGRRVFAFAGIARPRKFVNSLTQAGASIVGARWFDDHAPLKAVDRRSLRRAALSLNATLVTTEKDAARLDAPDLPFETLPINVHLSDPEAVTALLDSTLAAARARRPQESVCVNRASFACGLL